MLTNVRGSAVIPGAPAFDPRWLIMHEPFDKRPKLNATYDVGGAFNQAAINAALQTNHRFEIAGVNAADADVTHDTAVGSLKLLTAGADGDEVILQPHLDAGVSAWATQLWNTDDQLAWSAAIKTGSSIANCIIWGGFKLTSTEVKATDADQVFFRYEDDVNGGRFECLVSNTGTDHTRDSGVAVAADTIYWLELYLDADRVAHFLINQVLVATFDTNSTAKANTALKPYGPNVAADGAAAAKHIHVLRPHGVAVRSLR